MPVTLRPYRLSDESAAVAIHRAMLPDFHFLLSWDDSMAWADFVRLVGEQRRGVNLPPSLVRGDQLAAVVNDEIVGRVSIRFELNEFLAERGGHVGYGVAPGHRNRGYATEILNRALEMLRAEGVSRVLVTCDEENAASARVIEKNGRVFESHSLPTAQDDVLVRRYWIG